MRSRRQALFAMARKCRRFALGGLFCLFVFACAGPESVPDDGQSTNGPSVTINPGTSASSTGAVAIDTAGIDFQPPTERPIVEFGFEYFEFVQACAGQNGQHIDLLVGKPGYSYQGGTQRTRDVVEACMAAASAEDWVTPYPFLGSEESNRVLYGLWIGVHECLVENGYPTVEPPSEDAFAEGGSDLWNPYRAMLGAPTSGGGADSQPEGVVRQLEAQELCGADPGVLYQQELQNASG